MKDEELLALANLFARETMLMDTENVLALEAGDRPSHTIHDKDTELADALKTELKKRGILSKSSPE